ncbi:uncharacterized protein LOC116015955 [Ipomoea triloba]|uniref:uncharacterized protein LOC116015955 n=1 Tax=Ipomoea triloba TaxID=35885 RepID=UPI00125CF6EE|nr:uncharacterized protein LOC116015955 [Ipomoea triloba]
MDYDMYVQFMESADPYAPDYAAPVPVNSLVSDSSPVPDGLANYSEEVQARFGFYPIEVLKGNQRVPSAVYYLTKAADNWWATVGPDLRQDPGFSWEEFKVELRGQFYTERIKGIKCEEFLRLKQKGATVQDYHDKYVELMRFAQEIVPDEASKAWRFVRGLDWEVRRAIAPFLCSTLKEAYDRASDHYQVYLDQQEVYGRNKRKANDNQRKFRLENKKSNQGESNPKQGEKRGGTNQGKHSICWKCGKDHPGVNCQGMKIKCYKCGLTGHKYYECRTKVKKFPEPLTKYKSKRRI